MKFKNRLGASAGSLAKKKEPIWPRHMGCRGGAWIFEALHLVFRSILYIVSDKFIANWDGIVLMLISVSIAMVS